MSTPALANNSGNTPGAGTRIPAPGASPPTQKMTAEGDDAEAGQLELQQLLEQAFRKGVADGKKRELRRLFGNFGFNPPPEKSRLRDMRHLFDDNIKYMFQESTTGSPTLNSSSKYGSLKGGAGDVREEGREEGGDLSYRGGTYDSRSSPRRRSPPPPGDVQAGGYDSGTGHRSGGQDVPGRGYGSKSSRKGMRVRRDDESADRDGEKQAPVRNEYSEMTPGMDEQTLANDDSQNWEGADDDVLSPKEGVTMPKDLSKGGDIQVVKNFGIGGYGGNDVYDSRGRVVGKTGEYDTQGRKKPDKSHVSLGFNFKVHLSPKDGRLLSKVVGNKDKKDKKEKRGRRKQRKKRGRDGSSRESENNDARNEAPESEEEEKQGATGKVATKLLRSFISK